MIWKSITILGLVMFITCLTFASEKDKESVKIDEQVKDWSLKDTEDKLHSFEKLCEEKKAILLIFLATQCPVVDDYVVRINTLYNVYKEKAVQIVGIHSNKHEKIEEIKEYTKKHKFAFTILKDTDNVIADYFNARRTPEVFLIDSKKILRYRGAIDDSRQDPKTQHLRSNLDLVLEGKTVPDKQKKTRAIGCLIKRVRKTNIDRTP